MKVQVKVWLADDEGAGFLGHGRWELLCEVERRQSLQKAAQGLGISYRKAWGDVRAVEKHVGFAMLERRRGGRGGGSSALTAQAKRLLKAYARMEEVAAAAAQRQWQRFRAGGQRNTPQP